ncbi:MAG: TldD/PmbA family protein, partial [Candidatus Omnitrophota bacterium]
METPFLERIVDLAYKSLSIVEEGVRVELPSESAIPRAGRKWDETVTKKNKFQMTLALEKAARDYDRRITRVRDVSYSDEVRQVRLKNSRGLDLEDVATRYHLSLMVVAEEKEDQQMAWETGFSCRFSELNPGKVAGEAAEKALAQLGAKPIKTQKTAAVLDPMVAVSFLGVLASSFLGDQVQRNRSVLRGRLGEEIYSKEVTMIDDGSLPGGYATFPFDGEGTRTRRNPLVSKGILNQFLYDARSALESGEGKKSTGNAVRPHFKELPRVGATNFFVEAGEGTLEDLLAEMGTGFWIRDLIGVHTADPVTGDFSLGASGIWMEGGR